MKKVKIFILFMTLFLGMFFLMPIRVSAYTYNPDEDGQDFTPYKNEIIFYSFQDLMLVREDGTVLMVIYNISIQTGNFDYFQFYRYTDFSPEIEEKMDEENLPTYLRYYFDVNGLYWNPWLQLWQLEYPVEPVLTAADWFNHISQFDFGLAYGEIDDSGDITIVEEPGLEYEGFRIDYGGRADYEDYFEPELDVIYDLVSDDEDVVWYLEENYEDFDGYLYWNFKEKYWQIEYYETSELDYYKQRNDELEVWKLVH